MSEPSASGDARLIPIVGGESTGKSTLARALADRLPALLVPEVLRRWVDTYGRVPNRTEQWQVMRTQAAREAQTLAQLPGRADLGASQPRWVVSDSGPLMTAVYSVLYYGDDSLLPEALELLGHSRLIVWCADDFSWVPDEGQRDGEHMRRAAQEVIERALTSVPKEKWIRVRGDVATRTHTVVAALAAC